MNVTLIGAEFHSYQFIIHCHCRGVTEVRSGATIPAAIYQYIILAILVAGIAGVYPSGPEYTVIIRLVTAFTGYANSRSRLHTTGY